MPDTPSARGWREDIRRRLASLGLTPTREIEIVEEIAQHLDDRYARMLASGASDEDAAARAWRELEESDTLRRAISRVESPAPADVPPPDAPRSGRWPSTVSQDIRYSLRALRKSPLFSFTVLLALALSIGPVTAILSVGNWLLWRPQPGVTDASSLAVVWFGQWGLTPNGSVSSFRPAGVSYDNLAEVRSRARSFTGIAGVQEYSTSVAIAGALPRQLGTALVTADFFDVLGVRLSAGRTFTPDEDRGAFGAPVVVIGHGLARNAFGSAQDALGKIVTINSRPLTVIGVTNPAFEGTTNTGRIQVWVTGATWPYLSHAEASPSMTRGEGRFHSFILRAAPNTTFAEVEGDLKRLTAQLADLYPEDNEKFREVAPRVFAGLGETPLGRPQTASLVNMMLAVGAILLLLGCANVANLLMFRAARREHETVIRQALGASPLRLLQSQLMESWLLSAAGATLGLVLAFYLKELIEQLLFPVQGDGGLTIPIDLRVLGGTAAVALMTGTLSALAPAWLLTRRRGLSTMGRTTSTWARAPKLRSSLAVLQLALSLTLLVGALLLVSTLRNLRGVDLGFDPRGVTVLSFALDQHGYDRERALAYHREVLPALLATGGFQTVGVSTNAPFNASSSLRVLPGHGTTELTVRANGVSDTYFDLLSIPILRGRAFTLEETLRTSESDAVIVNDRLALRLYQDLDVVGRTVRIAGSGQTPPRALTIVGVAKHSRWRSIARETDPLIMYLPYSQFRSRGTSGMYLIKSSLPFPHVVETAKSVAARTGGTIPLVNPRTLTAVIDLQLNEERLFAWMLSLLAALGFALAALGLYGLTAQAMTERRRELGIRLALGAAGADIVRLVARHAIAVCSLGVAAGLLFSYFGTRTIQRMLFGVSALDPAVHATAVAALVLVVALACVGPVVRALRVQAVEILRAE